MPRTLPFAGALLALFVVATTGTARAAAADAPDAPEEAPSTTAITPSFYVGALTGRDNFFNVLGVDGTLAVQHLRVSAFAEVGGEVFGPSVGTVGGTVGVGTLPHARFDASLGVEAGVHHYFGLGDDLFRRTVSGGTADLPFAGVRASATWYFGRSRRVGLGVVGFARADLAHRTVATTSYGGLLEYRTNHSLEHAGWANAGAAVRLAVSF